MKKYDERGYPSGTLNSTNKKGKCDILMKKALLKESIDFQEKKGILYIKGFVKNKKPWLNNLFSPLYDKIMEKSIFPKKFEASISQHMEVQNLWFNGIREKSILELGTGSGNMSKIIDSSNQYVGLDISSGLLKIARKRFLEHNFNHLEFVICDASNLPFKDDLFDVCLCNLSMNFFDDINQIVLEIKRVLDINGVFFCSVPVSERNRTNQPIHGTLYSEKELKDIFNNNGFKFESYGINNGAVLYFKAVKTS